VLGLHRADRLDGLRERRADPLEQPLPRQQRPVEFAKRDRGIVTDQPATSMA
jgi:hypothetical protein